MSQRTHVSSEACASASQNASRAGMSFATVTPVVAESQCRIAWRAAGFRFAVRSGASARGSPVRRRSQRERRARRRPIAEHGEARRVAESRPRTQAIRRALFLPFAVFSPRALSPSPNSAINRSRRPPRPPRPRLPVEPEHQLPEAAARIVRVVRVRVAPRGLEDRRAGAGGPRVVRDLKLMLSNTFSTSSRNSKLVRAAQIGNRLRDADVEAREPRRADEQRPRRAVAVLQLDAVALLAGAK